MLSVCCVTLQNHKTKPEKRLLNKYRSNQWDSLTEKRASFLVSPTIVQSPGRLRKELFKEGAEMAFSHLPDRDPERPKAERKLRKLVEPHGAKVVLPCDVQDEQMLDGFFENVKQ